MEDGDNVDVIIERESSHSRTRYQKGYLSARALPELVASRSQSAHADIRSAICLPFAGIFCYRVRRILLIDVNLDLRPSALAFRPTSPPSLFVHTMPNLSSSLGHRTCSHEL